VTFYRWWSKCGGLGPIEVRWLKQIEDRTRRLKQVVADLTLDKRARRAYSTDLLGQGRINRPLYVLLGG